MSTRKEYVSREKYEVLKEKAQSWYERSKEFENKNRELSLSLEKSNSEVKRWKNYSENVPDVGDIEELEAENKNNKKTIRSLQKELQDIREKHASRNASLERDIMLKDGKILQLEEIQKELKERYKELKDDYREQQRWARDAGDRERK